MPERAQFTKTDARRIGEQIGIDWNSAPFDVDQLRRGMEVELEHGLHDALTNVTDDDPIVTAKIALAFDATAGDTAKQFAPSDGSDWAVAAEERKLGRLRVLLVRMNPDLTMGADLLKKTGAGNLFMVFGEPDVEIRRGEDGQVQVEIRGVDVYDPTTGQVRSSTTDDVACWFVDTNYNEESFFVREAYFTGAGDPYGSLRKALKADVDESAWASLYTTESRPFPRPESGRIAVKVINH